MFVVRVLTDLIVTVMNTKLIFHCLYLLSKIKYLYTSQLIVDVIVNIHCNSHLTLALNFVCRGMGSQESSKVGAVVKEARAERVAKEERVETILWVHHMVQVIRNCSMELSQFFYCI